MQVKSLPGILRPACKLPADRAHANQTARMQEETQRFREHQINKQINNAYKQIKQNKTKKAKTKENQ